MSRSIAGPARMTAAERRNTAVTLRKQGWTYQLIGDHIGVTKQAAHKLVTFALKELNSQTAESSVEVKRLELERLDEWTRRITDVLDELAPTPGQELSELDALRAVDMATERALHSKRWIARNLAILKAIDSGLRVQARRAKLRGLDAPTAVVNHGDNLAGEIVAAAARMGDAGALALVQQYQDAVEGGVAADVGSVVVLMVAWVKRRALPEAMDSGTNGGTNGSAHGSAHDSAHDSGQVVEVASRRLTATADGHG